MVIAYNNTGVKTISGSFRALRGTVAVALFAASAIICNLAVGQTGQMDLQSAAESAAEVHTVSDLLDFTADERHDINSCIDGDYSLDSPALYALLRRSCMAASEDILLESAAAIGQEDIRQSPHLFRAHLVLLHLDVYRVSRHEPTDAAAGRWWGRRPCWRVDCLDRQSGKPLVLMLAELPAWLDIRDYPQPEKASVSAFFCNMVRLKRTGDENSELYPVFVTRTIYGRQVTRGNTGHWLLGAIVLAMAGWWFYMKRNIARRKASDVAGADRKMPPTGEFDMAAVNEQLVEEMRRFKQRQNQSSTSDE